MHARIFSMSAEARGCGRLKYLWSLYLPNVETRADLAREDGKPRFDQSNILETTSPPHLLRLAGTGGAEKECIKDEFFFPLEHLYALWFGEIPMKNQRPKTLKGWGTRHWLSQKSISPPRILRHDLRRMLCSALSKGARKWQNASFARGGRSHVAI